MASVDRVIVSVAACLLAATSLCVLAAGTCFRLPASAAAGAARRWTSANAAKAWAERLFLLSSVPWVALMVAIVASRAYEGLTPAGYLAVGVALAAPGLLAPALSAPPACEAGVALASRYWVRAHAWLAVVVFVGSYFWTHYFYSLLRATYTFRAHRLNDVPLAMYLAAHAYFVLYHAATNMALRRWWTSAFYARLPGAPARAAGTAALVVAMAWATAFAEAFTIQGFPYYHIEDRPRMYTVGSVVYGLYFVVTFPMHYELDGGEPGAPAAPAGAPDAVADQSSPPPKRARSRSQARARGATALAAAAAAPDFGGTLRGAGAAGGGGGAPWSLRATVLHALAASMAVTLLLDFWRLAYTAAAGGRPAAAPGLPWTMWSA
jgi:cycloeucalenol cycloisomerase